MKIEVEKLSVKYRNIVALNNISLEIDSKRRVGLVGRNGAGKTTLIKTLLGLVKPNSGKIFVDGKELSNERDFLNLRSKVGYMPEEDIFIEQFTPLEYLIYSAVLYGIPEVEAKPRAHFLLELSGIKEERYRRIKGLSKGMKQKLKLAQAMINGGEFLFLDEPTSNLDPDTKKELISSIEKFSQHFEGGFLISSHILEDIERLCDYIIVIDNGEIRYSGEIERFSSDISQGIEIIVKGDRERFFKLIKELGGEIKKDNEKFIVKLKYGTSYDLKDRKIVFEKGKEINFLPNIFHTLCSKNIYSLLASHRFFQTPLPHKLHQHFQVHHNIPP